MQEQLLHVLSAAQNFLAAWTPANWIAFIAAIISLILGIYNNRKAADREKQKNKREEFHRRVAVPIEAALEQFRLVTDELHDLHDANQIVDDLDDVLRKARAAQRKLSRELRLSANSAHCTSDGWNVGQAEYDRFIEHLEALRTTISPNYKGVLKQAIDALDDHDKAVRRRIDDELARYT